MIRGIGLLIVGLCIGFMIATGDLACSIDPNAAQHLWDAVSTKGFTIGEPLHNEGYRF